jgi:hypothetical protein
MESKVMAQADANQRRFVALRASLRADVFRLSDPTSRELDEVNLSIQILESEKGLDKLD